MFTQPILIISEKLKNLSVAQAIAGIVVKTLWGVSWYTKFWDIFTMDSYLWCPCSWFPSLEVWTFGHLIIVTAWVECETFAMAM